MKELTIAEIKAIVMAESKYWSEAPGDLGITATGACANILAALYGFRAPWHPKPSGEESVPEQIESHSPSDR